MNDLVDLGTALLIVAGITVLVRPQSQGPGLVTAFLQGFAGLVSSATTF